MYRKAHLAQEGLREAWNAHAFFAHDGTDDEWACDEKEARKLFGPPPYEFLEVGDQVPARLPSNTSHSAHKRARASLSPNVRYTPSYAQLKNPHVTDEKHRQYWLLGPGDYWHDQVAPEQASIDDDTRPQWLVAFVRLPIHEQRERRAHDDSDELLMPDVGTHVRLRDERRHLAIEGLVEEMWATGRVDRQLARGRAVGRVLLGNVYYEDA